MKIPSDFSAQKTWTGSQIAIICGVLAAMAVSLAWQPNETWWVLNLLLMAGFSMVVAAKILSALAGLLLHDTEDADATEQLALNDEELPIYTILIPMYKEPKMVGTMLRNLTAMDYPADKLDAKLLLEADDLETQAAAAALTLPAWFQVLLVEDGRPKTKPRACNVGLEQARGEFLVIYDAEDRPERDQLKKSVAVFRRSPPKLCCLQARLNYFNPHQNLLTRWFTLEYSTWFDLFLPGLHSLRAPIPLGGTSNHFRTQVLREVGGWDAWNVTEDCDLGLRLARGGHETRILSSTTWEEAASTLGAWIPQRSRWVKGYWQTLLVHTRQPWRALREFGPWRFAMMLMVVAGHVYSLALYPFCWLALLVSQVRGESLFYPESPYTAGLFVATVMMIACNLVFIGIHAISAWQRRQPRLWAAALLLPLYWGLMSIAAWKGILQYFWAPFKWEKTPHGLAGAEDEVEGAATWQLPPRTAMESPLARFFSFTLITMLVAAVVGGSLYLPHQLEFEDQIVLEALKAETFNTTAEKEIEASWLRNTSLAVSISLDSELAASTTRFRAVLFLKVTDGEWYQAHTQDCVRLGDMVTVTASLVDADWQPVGTGRPWGDWCLRRVRSVGARLYSLDPSLGAISIRDASVWRETADMGESLVARDVDVPVQAAQNSTVTFSFSINREYENPYDSDEIDLGAEIISPDGSVIQATAFYYQDYSRHMEGKREILTAVGAPHWRIRFTPTMHGSYNWRLTGRDYNRKQLKGPSGSFDVTASAQSNFVRVDPQDSRYFSFADGRFFYPISMTIRSPHDERQPRNADYDVPHAESGTSTMDAYLARMQDSGIQLARVWMAPWFGGIEWKDTVPGYHGLGQYNLQNARRLDWVLESARKHGVWVDLVLQNHGAFTLMYDVDWSENPYNRINGGPLSTPDQVLMNRTARKHFRNRLRYIASRWGADPTIFGWTMWTEVEAVCNRLRDRLRWHSEMIPHLKTFDTGDHPVSTHYVNKGDRRVWSSDTVDYVQMAAYNYQSGLIARLNDMGQSMTRYDKPGFIEEYGGGALGGDMQPVAQCIHDGLWYGIVQPGAASPMSWWWNLVFAKDLDRFHKTAAAFVKGTDLRHQSWEYHAKTFGDSASNLRAVIRQNETSAIAWIYPNREVSLQYSGHYRWQRQPAALSAAYSKIVGDSYDPLHDRAPSRFFPITGASFTLRSLQSGSYRVEFWETWGSDVVTSKTLNCEKGRLEIELPEMTRDLALKVSRIPSDL